MNNLNLGSLYELNLLLETLFSILSGSEVYHIIRLDMSVMISNSSHALQYNDLIYHCAEVNTPMVANKFLHLEYLNIDLANDVDNKTAFQAY